MNETEIRLNLLPLKSRTNKVPLRLRLKFLLFLIVCPSHNILKTQTFRNKDFSFLKGKDKRRLM